MADAQVKTEKGPSLKEINQSPLGQETLNKELRALRGKNGPFRKWFISSYVVAYVILITK